MPGDMFKGIPSSVHAYLVEFSGRLQTIREAVKANLKQAQNFMLEKANQNAHEIEFKVGDYVYLEITPRGQGRKLKPINAGPYIINQMLSDHMVKLRDPSGKKKFANPIHVNRIKIKHAHIRQPNPQHFFENVSNNDSSDQTTVNGPIESVQEQVTTDSDMKSDHEIEQHQERIQPDDCTKQRPTRTFRKPARFRNDDHVDPNDMELSQTDVDTNMPKVKRILAKKRHNSGFLYLVQMVGEPSQNATGKTFAELSAKAQGLISTRHPPLVE